MKKSKQIVIVGQTVYLIIASILILTGFGLIAIVSAQVTSVIIVRWLSHNTFYDHELKQKLNSAIPRSRVEVLKVIYPNAIKIGLTTLGGVVAQRSAIVIGSLYLSLGEIASYGITMQLIAVMASLSGIYIATFQPKFVQLRVENNKSAIKELYIKGHLIFSLSFILGGSLLILLGGWAMNIIGSQTPLMGTSLILLALIISFLEFNYNIAISILLTKNEVPFFKASLLTGVSTILLLFILFYFTDMKLWALVIAPGIAYLYNDWKWPYELFRQLKITSKDIRMTYNEILKSYISIITQKMNRFDR